MSTKADQARAWLKGSDLKSHEIAQAVGCHSGFVRAIKQRMLHPERENERNSRYYRENFNGRRDKALAREQRRREANREQYNAYRRGLRARKRAAAEACP